MKYSHIVLGGTFDFLHAGHKSMLEKAFHSSQRVTIGLTTDQFNKTRGKESFQNQDTRLYNLKAFFKKKGYLKRAEIILIDDIFGSTLENPLLEAIVVTKETVQNVGLINQKRIKNNLKSLQTILVPHLKNIEGKVISSSRIRSGQIDLEGKSYKKLLLEITGKKLPDQVRIKLKKPLGRFLTDLSLITDYLSLSITIGDVTYDKFIKSNIQPNLAIIDGRVARKNIPISVKPSQKIKNPPGQISKALILAINQALKKILVPGSSNLVLFINGEEDLAAIPAILLSPLNTRVYYGQPNEGLVEVKVNLDIKDKIIRLLGF